MSIHNPTIIATHIEEQLNIFQDRVTRVTNVVQELQHHRLSVDLLNFKQLSVYTLRSPKDGQGQQLWTPTYPVVWLFPIGNFIHPARFQYHPSRPCTLYLQDQPPQHLPLCSFPFSHVRRLPKTFNFHPAVTAAAKRVCGRQNSQTINFRSTFY